MSAKKKRGPIWLVIVLGIVAIVVLSQAYRAQFTDEEWAAMEAQREAESAQREYARNCENEDRAFSAVQDVVREHFPRRLHVRTTRENVRQIVPSIDGTCTFRIHGTALRGNMPGDVAVLPYQYDITVQALPDGTWDVVERYIEED